PWSLDFSWDQRWLASGHEDGVRLWDLMNWKEVAFLPSTRTALLDPNGKWLITTGTNGAYRWEIRTKQQGEQETLEIGPPQLLGETAGSEIWDGSLSANGRILALSDRTHGQAIVVNLDDKPSR